MTKPSLRRAIYDRFVEALGQISTTRGFSLDLKSSQKVLPVNESAQKPCIVTTMPEEEKEVTTNDHYLCTLQFESQCFVEDLNEGDTESVEDACEDLLSDVERAILELNAMPSRMGLNYVHDIRLGGHSKFISDDETAQGFVVFGAIRYRHSVLDPRIP